MKLARSLVLASVALATGTLYAASHGPDDPALPGPYVIRTALLVATLPNGTLVPFSVRLPAAVSAPRPLVLVVHGYATVGTRNGIEALDLARQHRPDLILMDIQLPEVSGLEVTKWLKDDPELRVIPVVAVTAFAMKGDEERIREGGCEAYLSKPISVGKFIETIRHFLGNA